jgi:hypothetical protein
MEKGGNTRKIKSNHTKSPASDEPRPATSYADGTLFDQVQYLEAKYDGLGLGTLAFNNASGIGRGGTGALKVDGREVARQSMEHTMPLIMQWDENFDIGADTGTPVDDHDYQVPFKFTGTLDKLTLTIDRPKLSPADIEKLKEATRNNRAAE